jgi:2-polyprenyl-6-hydroxyphenyl methylase/3-demethylubiquinone-9 3-methyltransferase
MNGDAYYRDRLSASKLLKCYEIAPPRIRQYLEAEAQFVVSNVQCADAVLELGCGYGRVLKAVAPYVSTIVGNDISRGSLHLAKSYMKPYGNYRLVQTDACNMGFRSCTFDAVFCIQNGISAFKADPKHIIEESIRVTKNNGLILFSSYSPSIWKERLDWFRKQSEAGLIGEIDEHKTHDGTIACKDGFTATTFSSSEFIKLFAEAGQDASIIEVDNSSIFCKVVKKKKHV